MTKKWNFDDMTVDEMWKIREEVTRVLSIRLTSEKRELEKRLTKLREDRPIGPLKAQAGKAPRRKYPRVYPKYRNTQVPHETWSGRGKTPRWLAAALKTGHKIEEFVIKSGSADRAVQKRRK